jgi:hypothetical protein
VALVIDASFSYINDQDIVFTNITHQALSTYRRLVGYLAGTALGDDSRVDSIWSSWTIRTVVPTCPLERLGDGVRLIIIRGSSFAIRPTGIVG